jgi:hypothetical protein
MFAIFRLEAGPVFGSTLPSGCRGAAARLLAAARRAWARSREEWTVQVSIAPLR